MSSRCIWLFKELCYGEYSHPSIHREPAPLWRPQGHPNVKIWQGDVLPTPTAAAGV
jgi:hypothetical protein